MPFWSSIYIPNSNSPLMEQLLFLHDHSMIILIIVSTLISYIMINLLMNKFYNKNFIENHNLEMLWTIMPLFLLIFIAIPSLRILYLLDENYKPNLTLKIIGHQWYWSYEIKNFNLSYDCFMIPNSELTLNNFRLLDTDNNVILPFNMNNRILCTSADVIHAWTIPTLGVKMDAIPGRLNQALIFSKRPGLFFGQCSEICGVNHSFMPITMEMTSVKNFLNFYSN
uniref:Cytochrome c oxidase subunit 2 n=1 Tax=Dermanyssus gallinae TaxID=34641 RepID=A0A7U3PYZ5_9ACAR|nr:cytochrome c oxidase subunit II [Dermanyssus gallinae]QPG86040.1 cytochrome c oxidase subunit 2 [Dermanyssus gallinae]